MMEQIEQRLGNYRLIQLLGKGTFADVYLGEHLYLNTPVAIKVLRSKLDPSTLAGFLNEARQVSHLVHPHIVRVFDFGLELLASDQEVLRVKERFGTLSYMAPELILGQPVPASDQYALAVMVYEWLCGHLPFVGSAVHISNQHLYAIPPSLCKGHPEIPRAVEQVVLKGLSKEPAQRFVDVLNFARTLEEACYTFANANMLSTLSAAPSFESSSYLDDLSLQFQNVPMPLTPLIGRA